MMNESFINLVEQATQVLLSEKYSMDKSPNKETHGKETIEYYNVYYNGKKVGSVTKVSDDYWASGGIGPKDIYFSDNHKTKEAAYKALIKQKPHKGR